MTQIEIDKRSGCCFGVTKAIRRAEEELKKGTVLYCLGDIVHNNEEVSRLKNMGLIIIDHEQFKQLKNASVLLRAHGEPPSTYEIAKQNNIEIIDASCPVVLRIQNSIKEIYEDENKRETQIVIYGKKGHAEVIGLVGQTEDTAIIIEKKEDLDAIDFSRNISFFSQTTKSLDGFKEIVEIIKSRLVDGAKFEFFDTICRQVSNRIPNIEKFAKNHDIIFFVAGKKSSNGKELFSRCLKMNKNSHFISLPDEIDESVIKENMSIGICGATSTPKWQMELVAETIKKITSEVTIAEI